MTSRTITTSRTVGQRVRNVVLLAGGAILAYGGIHAIPRLLDTHARGSHAAEVRELITGGHLEQASELFASYRTADGLRTADAVALQALLNESARTAEFAQTIAPFDAAVGKYDYPTASAELDRLRSTISPAQQSGLEQRLAAISDEGMFQRILTAKPGERDELLRAYLTGYQQGTHRRDVAMYAIAENLDTLLATIDQRKPVFQIISQMHAFNALCTTYGGEAAPLPSEIPLALIEIKVRDYLVAGRKVPIGDFKVGDCVSIKELEFSDIPHSNSYLIQRNRNFPPGSIGYVVGTSVDTSQRSSVYVEFPDAQVQWDDDWEQVPLDLRKPTVAAYYTKTISGATEVIGRPHFTSAEQSVLQLELGRLLVAINPLLPQVPVSGTNSEPRLPEPASLHKGSQTLGTAQ